MTDDLSAFYFDIRKDALYCDPHLEHGAQGALTVIDQVFRCVATWLAPILAFTAEEAWLARYPGRPSSVHLETFPEMPAAWRDDALAEHWAQVRRVRRVVTGALEIERAQKRIGASLEAAPVVYIADDEPVRGRRRPPRPRRDLHHLGPPGGAGRGPGRGLPPRRREGRRGRAASGDRAANALVPGSSRPMSAPTPTTRT